MQEGRPSEREQSVQDQGHPQDPPHQPDSPDATESAKPAKKRRGWRRGIRSAVLSVLLLVVVAPVIAVAVTGCIISPPRADSIAMEDRLRAFPTEGLPLQGEASVYWNEYQVPFIHASSDDDVPLLMGIVHAHLRLGQMELLRRFSQGRVSETAGPVTVGLDHTLRALDFGRAVDQIEEQMPEETRRWVERYVEGINLYRERLGRRPAEFRAMGLTLDEPWTVEDVLTVGRLASADVNWARFFSMAQIRDEREYEEIHERLRGFHDRGRPSFGPDEPTPLSGIFERGRTGSNSIAVSSRLTESGSAMIANDPHVGMQLPPLWVVVGYRSPSHAAVGFMIPSLPVVLLGRNDHIAWGGTNMIGLNSAFYDVSDAEGIERSERTERIGVRFWRDQEVKISETSIGPLISDTPLLEDLALPDVALKWRGHEPSDELTAFLRVTRASDWESFRSAFSTYAVSGQNFLYADKDGNIGQLLAMEFAPAAGEDAIETLFADPVDIEERWQIRVPSTELPTAFNPDTGFLVSTNNTPTRLSPPVSVTGNSDDRQVRISHLLENGGTVTVDRLGEIQMDVYSEASRRAARAMVSRASRLERVVQEPERRRLIDAIDEWDGKYEADSRGAVAYQLLAHALITRHYREQHSPAIARFVLRSTAAHDLLEEDLDSGALSDEHLAEAVHEAAGKFRDGRVWGDMHTVRLAHPLGRIPILGSGYNFGEVPVGGSATTVKKTSHSISDSPSPATFGVNARHISDLADLDSNHFVLLGGQDGWLGSKNFLDQVPLWREGRTIRVPLRQETVEAEFTRVFHLEPASQ